MIRLPESFLRLPLAHRALHDLSAGRPENSRAAIEAACQVGYGIEIDIQPSRNGVPMVFHDDDLKRLTGQSGQVSDLSAQLLGDMTLQGTRETVPPLDEVLKQVAGRVPLLIEVKDQRGEPRSGTNALVGQILDVVGSYAGPLALMSFNPFAVAHGSALRPDLPWGVTTGHGVPLWPQYRDLDLKFIQSAIAPSDFGASFVSHGLAQADAPWLRALRDRGTDILSWTIRSPEDARRAREFADNITFEHFLPAIPESCVAPA